MRRDIVDAAFAIGHFRRYLSTVIPAAVDLVLRDFAARLRERFGDRVAQVRLYGSHARGEAHEESDIDVLVALRGMSWRDKVDAIDLAAGISVERGVRLSAVALDVEELERLFALETRFVVDAMREGIPV